jgi:hypothetical protein
MQNIITYSLKNAHIGALLKYEDILTDKVSRRARGTIVI